VEAERVSATTAAKLLYRLRILTDDPSSGDPRFALPVMLDALDRATFEVHSKLPGRVSINAAFVALVANDYDYALSEVDPWTLARFIRTSDGGEVHRVSLDEFMVYRIGNPTASGPPLIIAFQEAASGVVTAYVWPTPSAADTIQAEVATMITSTFQGIANSDLTSTSLNFGPYGTLAIVYLAAALLMPERSDLEARSSNLVFAESQRMLYQQAGDGVLDPVLP
jgi:hypothetical protein